MTQTELIEIIKMTLGASHIPFEIDDDGIMDIIRLRTLPSFSKSFPHMEIVDVDPIRDRINPSEYGKYFLRSDLKVTGVAKAFRNEQATQFRNMYGAQITNLFDYQAFMDSISAVYTPDTWAFHPPNIIEMFPKYYNADQLLVVAKCEHPDHLMTIPEGLRDEFIDLALADVKIALYPIRKRFASVNSTYGNIELNLEVLENGREERKEILEKWHREFFKEPNRKKIFFY